MKSFLKDILITLGLGLLLAIPFDISTSLGENVYTTKYNYLNLHKEELSTLVVGSCLASNGFNSLELGDSTYNTGIFGQSMFFDVELMKELIPQMSNLKTIIYPFHYNLHLADPSAFLHNNRAAYLTFRNARYWHIKKTYRPMDVVYKSALLAGEFHYKNCKSAPDTTYLGYCGFSGMYYNGKDEGGNPPLQLDPERCEPILCDLAEICKENNVRLIVIIPPFTNTWLSQTTDEGHKCLQSIIESVCSKYPVEYKNYMWDSSFRNDSLYFDWNHLNREGGTLFAQRVKQDFGL